MEMSLVKRFFIAGKRLIYLVGPECAVNRFFPRAIDVIFFKRLLLGEFALVTFVPFQYEK